MFQVANTKMPQACLFHCFYLGLDPSDAKAAANRGCDSKYQAIHKSDFREIGHGKQVSEQTTGQVTTHREVKGVHENLKLDDYGLTSQKTCYGGSLETELQISGTFRKETQRQIDGVIGTVDVLGKPMSEQSTGFMRMQEQESDRVSLGSVAADRVKSTLFEGPGSDFRLGSSQTPSARLQVGEGTFEESSRIASIDGTRLETSRTLLLGSRTAASDDGNSIDVRRGYIHSNDMKKSCYSDQGFTKKHAKTTSFAGKATDFQISAHSKPTFRAFVGKGDLSSATSSSISSWTGSKKDWQEDNFQGVVVRLNGLDLDTGSLSRMASRSDHSLISGYAVQEASTHQKLLGVETCLTKDMSVSRDAFGFMYSQRSASCKKGWWNNTVETVQLPFVQYSRKGAATIDSAGLVQLSDGAEITDYSLSDVTKNSILRHSANLLHDRNIHNLDAGMTEIMDGAWMCAKSASMDEFTHGFVSAMKNRGYPTSNISMAVNLVGKPLWRAYQTDGQKGFAQAVQHSLQDLLAATGDATERPAEFVLSCVNSAAPLLGSDLNVQWNEDYKGFRMMGYGLGAGRQIDVGKNGFVEDTGIHGSYRFRSTLNTVGQKLSVASVPLKL